jgi:hypothetical protein
LPPGGFYTFVRAVYIGAHITFPLTMFMVAESIGNRNGSFELRNMQVVIWTLLISGALLVLLPKKKTT